MAYVAYAVVLSLLGGAGVAFWARDRDRPPILPAGDRASPPAPTPAPAAPPAPVEPSRAAQGLKLPPRPAAPAANAPVARNPGPPPVPIPSPSPIPAAAPSPPAVAGASDPPAAPGEKPAPTKSKCTVDGTWPAEKTEQGKAIQGMLRDLGLYEGTVYGTVGPATRAAIRKFQVSAGDAETGEPDQALFESLRRKCAAPSP